MIRISFEHYFEQNEVYLESNSPVSRGWLPSDQWGEDRVENIQSKAKKFSSVNTVLFILGKYLKRRKTLKQRFGFWCHKYFPDNIFIQSALSSLSLCGFSWEI